MAVNFVGDSGDDTELDRDTSAKRCCIICSNFSTYRSLRSLACKIWRSRVDSWGIKDKSMELTASYKAASVSGKGDLKYSSRASNRSGYQVINILKGDAARNGYLVYMKKRMSSADCHCFNHRPPIRHHVSSRRKGHRDRPVHETFWQRHLALYLQDFVHRSTVVPLPHLFPARFQYPLPPSYQAYLPHLFP